MGDFKKEFKINFRGKTYQEYLLVLINRDYLNFEYQPPTEYLTWHFVDKVDGLCINRNVETISELFHVISMVSKQSIIYDLRNPENKNM